MAGRPELGRDDSYNRVRLTSDMKTQIYSMIDDSSESLPLASVAEDDDSENLPSAVDKNHLAPTSNSSGNPASRLSESMQSSDFATPTPEKPNPLEQIPTVREHHMSDPVLETPSPVRSHELVGHEKAIAPRIVKIMEPSESDLNLSKNSKEYTDVAGDKETLGSSASRQTTLSATPSNASGKKETKDGSLRPGMMKRMSTAIKRQVSKNQ